MNDISAIFETDPAHGQSMALSLDYLQQLGHEDSLTVEYVDLFTN